LRAVVPRTLPHPLVVLPHLFVHLCHPVGELAKVLLLPRFTPAEGERDAVVGVFDLDARLSPRTVLGHRAALVITSVGVAVLAKARGFPN
jgi:hypothetical protein